MPACTNEPNCLLRVGLDWHRHFHAVSFVPPCPILQKVPVTTGACFCCYNCKSACREAAFMASVTVRCSVFGVHLAIPLLELPCAAASPASVGTAQPAHSKQPAATPAPSAEVAELQRRLAASGDENVASLMSINPEQLDPLDARGISRWLRAKGRNMDVAEEQIHIHAHWRQEFMPAGHIPEVNCNTPQPCYQGSIMTTSSS